MVWNYPRKNRETPSLKGSSIDIYRRNILSGYLTVMNVPIPVILLKCTCAPPNLVKNFLKLTANR